MHLGIGALLFGVVLAVYFVLLYGASRRRRTRMINDHPFGSPYDPARGAGRQGRADVAEARAAISYVRGTR